MMSDEKALTTTSQTSALDVYGSGDDIKTLARRIKLCLPGGDKLQDHEALALAQLSIAYQLNAFNGEVWYIPGKGTQVGIKGLRKAARHQSNYWLEHVLLTDEERRGNLVPDKAIAYKCILHRTDMMLTAAAIIKAMRDAGMENAFEVYAYRPAIGIGYWTPGESTKMKGDQAARKRSEAEALKVAFDLPFASEIGNGDRIGYVDAEWSEVQDVAPKLTGEALQARVRENIEILRGNPDDPDPLGIDTGGPIWDANTVKSGEEPPKPEPDLDDVFPRNDPPPAPPAQPGKPKVAVKTGKWNAAAAALAERQPYYQTDGRPNFYKMLGCAGKHAGVTEITDANLADVISALTAHAVEEMEPKPGDVVEPDGLQLEL